MKHTVELEKLDQLIAAKETELEKWTFKSELKHLSTELMKHVQAQQDYLEKQNVLVYLEKIMAHPELRDIESLEDKIAAYEKRNENHRQEKIPENTKAHKFLIKMVNKMASIEPKEHQRFVDELLESIINYYKSAVKATHRINKKYEGKCKQAEKETKTHETEIREKETQISELIAQKDYLNHAEKQKGNDDQLFIRVKNELGEYTVIKGKEAQLITEKPIHGVFIRERQATDDEKAEMLIQGSFEE